MRLLLVEDEQALAGPLADALRAQGFAVDLAGSIAEARLEAGLAPHDAVILDRRLPDGDGLGLCREWRAGEMLAPVLVLTARDGVPEIVAGLEAGGDDYLTKPFDLDELIARIRSLIRRGPVLRGPVIEIADLEIDPAKRRVRQAGAVISLTAKEFAILEHLAARAGDAVSRYQLLEHCWDHAFEPGSNVVDVHIRALRRKLGFDLIETVRGAGYRIAADEHP